MPWFCAQIGAREHYAVPRVLHQSGRLTALYTDFWAGPGWRRMGKSKLADGRWKMGALRSLASRWHPELQEKAETLKIETLKGVGAKAESRKQKTVATEPGPENPAPAKFPLSGFSGSAFSSKEAEIISWNLRALWWEILRKVASRHNKAGSGKRKAESGSQNKDADAVQPSPFQLSTFPISTFSPYAGFIEVGRRFATCVREDLKRRTDLSAGTIFYAYDTGALEAFEWCRERGVRCVLNQMDPNRVEVELVRAEEKQWPGWAVQGLEVPEAYFARREREWALADRIVVNSEFSRRALLQQGVPPAKLVVIPLCYEAKAENRKQRSDAGEPLPAEPDKSEFPLSTFSVSAFSSSSPLRVLFLGQVILRKGIKYLIAAAKLLERENIHFDIVGPLGISASAIATAPQNLRFHGRTSRDQAAAWYRQSQVFVLPTLSDGFAITQLEAMAHGLPVVTTPCCGEVVSDGGDGFVVPARDAGALAQALQRYLVEPDLLTSQSAAARIKARQFTRERLAENLRQLEEALMKS